MDVIIERACGMDVHKDSITACILTPEGKEIKTFSTKTVFLLKLLDWIKDMNVLMLRWKVRMFTGSQS
jgi:transposase